MRKHTHILLFNPKPRFSIEKFLFSTSKSLHGSIHWHYSTIVYFSEEKNVENGAHFKSVLGRQDFPRHLVLIPANETELPLLKQQPRSWNSVQGTSFYPTSHPSFSGGPSVTVCKVLTFFEKKSVPYDHLTTWASHWMCVSDNVNNGAMVDITALSVSIKAPWYWRSEYHLAIIIIRLVDGLLKTFLINLLSKTCQSAWPPSWKKNSEQVKCSRSYWRHVDLIRNIFPFLPQLKSKTQGLVKSCSGLGVFFYLWVVNLFF